MYLYFNSEQEKESIIRVRMGLKNLSGGLPFGITRLAEGWIFLSHPHTHYRF